MNSMKSASVTGLALIAASICLATPATADDCLLDTNDDGTADSNVDTDGNASSDGVDARLACGVDAVASGGGRAHGVL